MSVAVSDMRLFILAGVLILGVRAQLLLQHESCSGRCFLQHDYSKGCQCDYDCETYGNCCGDFWQKCRGSEYGLVVSQQELNQLAQSLWDSDVNRISSNLYTLNTQSQVTVLDGDKSSAKLIVPDAAGGLAAILADHNTTYPSFVRLLNNYVADRSHAEHHPIKEIQEEVAFWDAISKTRVVQIAFRFLVDQGYLKGDMHAFHTLINEMWFMLYPHNKHSTTKTDSGFEHVMLGEINPAHGNHSATVYGFNNWIQFYLKEQAGSLDYMGYIKSAKNPDLIDARFTWNNAVSKGSSFFVGTSPEFDLCLFTVCAVVHPNKPCPVLINGHRIVIHTTTTKHHFLQQLTSASPSFQDTSAIVG